CRRIILGSTSPVGVSSGFPGCFEYRGGSSPHGLPAPQKTNGKPRKTDARRCGKSTEKKTDRPDLQWRPAIGNPMKRSDGRTPDTPGNTWFERADSLEQDSPRCFPPHLPRLEASRVPFCAAGTDSRRGPRELPQVRLRGASGDRQGPSRPAGSAWHIVVLPPQTGDRRGLAARTVHRAAR